MKLFIYDIETIKKTDSLSNKSYIQRDTEIYKIFRRLQR